MIAGVDDYSNLNSRLIECPILFIYPTEER